MLFKKLGYGAYHCAEDGIKEKARKKPCKDNSSEKLSLSGEGSAAAEKPATDVIRATQTTEVIQTGFLASLLSSVCLNFMVNFSTISVYMSPDTN